ncbi:N-myc protein isoform X3 [Cryptotermes secundus]|uniref:N-myc protein isoform X3 n=1 Tax=Cryptotermes secundus TaxID=105785 RepID=UPI000CD7B99F|nr:N-myc protein isoform X3 [Cryptotermes secundus]
MYEDSMYPGNEVWEKFEFPPMSSDWEGEFDLEAATEEPQVVPSHVMGGRHDCMWSGICSSEKHKKPCYAVDPVVAVTLRVRPVKSSRSLLRTTRAKAPTTSPRPDTPSESEEDEPPVWIGEVCDNEDLSVSVSVSEVTGQILRTGSEFKTLSPPPSPARAFYTDHSYHISKSAVTLDNLGVQTPSDSADSGENPDFTYPDSPESLEFEGPRTSARRRVTPRFYDPRAYDTSSQFSEGKPRRRTPETPSEVNCETPYYHQNSLIVDVDDGEEEEIDVVSVVDREKLTTLPTNPTARDRQQLQRTVASAIHQRASRGHKRPSSDDEKRSYKRRRAGEDGEDSSERRNQHNDMERKRRVDMRDAISNLRKLVPAVSDNKRAAKVLILNEAAAYCRQLHAVGEHMSRAREELYRRQKVLSARLKELRVQNAKIRGSVEKSPRKKRMGSRSCHNLVGYKLDSHYRSPHSIPGDNMGDLQ